MVEGHVVTPWRFIVHIRGALVRGRAADKISERRARLTAAGFVYIYTRWWADLWAVRARVRNSVLLLAFSLSASLALFFSPLMP